MPRNDSPLFLLLDTCGSAGSVAVVRVQDDGWTTLAYAELAGKTFSAQLTPKIAAILQESGLTATDLSAIGVVHGPGSFTGIRVGLSTAKALAEVAGKPLLAVSRLAVLARKAQTEYVALDAHRGEVYFRSPRGEGLALQAEAAAQTASPVGLCEESLEQVFPAVRKVDPPTAVDAAPLFLEAFDEGSFADPVQLDGHYLRRSDAEIFSKPRLMAALAESKGPDQ